ncbi:MAG: LysR family transcriptional regulator [Sedimentisphaerales bacterium]|nr:LysR family transcriptional regulator [Sedimentisphaerales bacterium]
MNIETFKIFCDLVELRSFSRTAEKHGISQSAVSQQLAQLEIAHKCQLLNRKKRPPELTQTGEIFYLAARDIQDRYDRLTHELATLSRPGSRIRIAAIFSIGMHTLQPYVTRFMAKYPTVHLRIEYGDAEAIYDRILKGDIDIGVVAVPKKIRHIDVYPFVDEPLVLVCSPAHLLAGAGSVDIHKLQGMEFIAFEKDVPSRNWIDGILSQYSVNPRIVLEFDNIETIKRAVEINSGVSILPETTIRNELANQTLKSISFSNERFYRPTGIIVRKNRAFSQAGRYLIELLQKGEHGHEHDPGRDL